MAGNGDRRQEVIRRAYDFSTNASPVPIPSFSIDGVLPPYVGASGPGGRAEDMSPYVVTALEIVSTLGGTDRRNEILRGWLGHRAALRILGFQRGFQWLDGSFVEAKEPRDLDVVTFIYRPATIMNAAALSMVVQANGLVFDRMLVKDRYMLDAFFVDLNAPPESIVNVSRYWLGLFSHRRADDLWKGLLQVRLETVADDATASAALGSMPSRGGAP